jgi:hypothetical protein
MQDILLIEVEVDWVISLLINCFNSTQRRNPRNLPLLILKKWDVTFPDP